MTAFKDGGLQLKTLCRNDSLSEICCVQWFLNYANAYDGIYVLKNYVTTDFVKSFFRVKKREEEEKKFFFSALAEVSAKVL